MGRKRLGCCSIAEDLEKPDKYSVKKCLNGHCVPKKEQHFDDTIRLVVARSTEAVLKRGTAAKRVKTATTVVPPIGKYQRDKWSPKKAAGCSVEYVAPKPKEVSKEADVDGDDDDDDNCRPRNPFDLSTYSMPDFAIANYRRYLDEINATADAHEDPPDDLFYARGTRRQSIFYDTDAGCYSNETLAPKNRTGRKMKSSIHVFMLSNYLLNTNSNRSSCLLNPDSFPKLLKTLHRPSTRLRVARKRRRRAGQNGNSGNHSRARWH
ncbi:unnamed protein product [Soboliphyme baturini]|uniref:Expressed conserved protein n=1 Tax=Soboliphyme baturini TaxID=241478 RepID=A0A183IUJ5_9BILA|nr:unnamed protein product [Soboliphyme baturini]